MEKKYQETLDYLHEEAAKASPHSQHETNLLTLIDVFEELIKENKYLKENYKKLHKTYIEEYELNRELDKHFKTSVNDQLIKFKKVIEILKCFLNYVEVEFDTFVTSQCTDEGQKLLKEVFGEYEPVAINNVSWEE